MAQNLIASDLKEIHDKKHDLRCLQCVKYKIPSNFCKIKTLFLKYPFYILFDFFSEKIKNENLENAIEIFDDKTKMMTFLNCLYWLINKPCMYINYEKKLRELFTCFSKKYLKNRIDDTSNVLKYSKEVNFSRELLLGCIKTNQLYFDQYEIKGCKLPNVLERRPLLIIDLRSNREFQKSHIKESINISDLQIIKLLFFCINGKKVVIICVLLKYLQIIKLIMRLRKFVWIFFLFYNS